MKPLSVLDAALSYAARGWSVIPLCSPDHDGCTQPHLASCKKPGKVPLLAEWQKAKPVSPEYIKAFWHKLPCANVGVAMGPVSGLVGLDIDGEAGNDWLCSKHTHEIPITLEFVTGGNGTRLLFRWPTDPILAVRLKTRSFKIDGKEAVRLQAAGSQTVMPPSIHQNLNMYEWEAERSPTTSSRRTFPPGCSTSWKR